MASNTKTHAALCGIIADDIFRGIDAVSESMLAKIKKSKQFAPGTSILRNGDKPSAVCILRSGTAKVWLDYKCSNETKFRMAEMGEIFGLTECIADSEITRTIQAISECEFDVFHCGDLMNFIVAEPKMCLRLTRAIGNSISKGNAE